MKSCNHTIGISESGGITRCQACGEVSHRTETRPCGGCAHCVPVVNGHICNRHLSAISPSHLAGYGVEQGTCWEPRSSTVPSMGQGVGRQAQERERP
jgi:hypothetical protein